MNAKWILRLLLGAVLMVGLVGCKPAAGGGGDQAEVLVEKDANGTTVTLDVDQVLAIKLESNPTTGYAWQVMEVDETILQAEGGPEMIEPAQATPMLGAGGWQVFRYRAKASGETVMTLGYARSFEPDVAPIETFTLTVKVR
ncbi:MAG: protease inhibitor I42 family protein [Chloroflexi bacterium]|nr:protease inhibitor I42 family protein [Chloroflexota bacterium]